MQKLLSDTKLDNKERSKIGYILDLEKKYFDILWGLFTSQNFVEDLKIIEKEIQRQYSFLENSWDLKNKLKIPAERLAKQYIYRNFSNQIKHIYPSPISSDVAFLTDDAVISIDIKTLDTIGNKNDINNLQFENNQSSFVNKNLDVDNRFPNSGVKVECLLPKEYSWGGEEPLPVLTYFLTIIYSDNKKSFHLNRDMTLQTIYLKCLPNGSLSKLFDEDLIDNFKTYSYLDHKHGFNPIYMTDNFLELDNKIRDFVKKHSDFKLIKGKTKLGAYNIEQIHPKYKTKGVSWFPVSRQDKKNKKVHKYYLEAVNKGHTSRVSNSKLEIRYDSKDKEWLGVKKYRLN